LHKLFTKYEFQQKLAKSKSLHASIIFTEMNGDILDT